jgi:hypothetical protein
MPTMKNRKTTNKDSSVKAKAMPKAKVMPKAKAPAKMKKC